MQHNRIKWKIEGKCVQCGNSNDRFPITICTACTKLQAARSKSWLIRIKKAAFEAYGGCFCVCCNETIFELLTLDHTNNDSAKHREELRGGDGLKGGGGGRLYSWLKQNKYPLGFRVLCWNCNAAIGMFGTCPHELMLSFKNPLLLVSAC